MCMRMCMRARARVCTWALGMVPPFSPRTHTATPYREARASDKCLVYASQVGASITPGRVPPTRHPKLLSSPALPRCIPTSTAPNPFTPTSHALERWVLVAGVVRWRVYMQGSMSEVTLELFIFHEMVRIGFRVCHPHPCFPGACRQQTCVRVEGGRGRARGGDACVRAHGRGMGRVAVGPLSPCTQDKDDKVSSRYSVRFPLCFFSSSCGEQRHPPSTWHPPARSPSDVWRGHTLEGNRHSIKPSNRE